MKGAGQRSQESDNCSDLLVRQRSVKLRGRHLAHRIVEGRRTAVMEVGSRGCDISQAWYAQDLGEWRSERTKYAVPFIKIATDIHTLMAGGAAKRFEQSITGLLVGRECPGIAAKPAVKAATRGHQRPLKGGNCIQQAGPVRSVPIGVIELTYHLPIGTQPSKDLIDTGRHVRRVFQRGLGLGLKSSKIPFPVQPEAQCCVEHRQGGEWKSRPVACFRSSTIGGSIGVEVVAGRAGKCTIVRQAAIHKEAFSKRKLQWIGGRCLRDWRYRFLVIGKRRSRIQEGWAVVRVIRSP